MRKITLFILASMAVFGLAGCAPPETNAPATNANANANTAKPVAAAPTKEALLALEQQANEAWVKGDSAFFEGFLSDKFVIHQGGRQMSKADLVKMVGQVKCDVKSWSLDDPQMSMIDADTAVIVTKGTFDGTCDGQKLPSPIRAASVYIRSGDKWLGAFHGEVPIVEAGAAPSPAATPADRPAANANANTNMANTSSNSNSNAAETKPAAPAPSTNTAALAALHTQGWEAWKNKDAKWFEANTTSNLSIVDPMGGWIGSKADVIKAWTTMDCQGVTTVNFSDTFAAALSPTVEILTGKGTADGTCMGQKNAPLLQTAVYVKEGDAWKLAFMLESPAT
ncbi:hypothetical protein BH24ACI3_BH24ACI3_07020 [soil metagenome]